MIPADSGMEEVLTAVARLQAGDVAQGRGELLALWTMANGVQQRCVLAHFLADTEQEVSAELEWDLLALEAATGTRSASGEPLSPAVAAFLPSLHLNAGDAYRRLGDHERAGLHAEAGLSWLRTMPETGYTQMIDAGLHRLLARVSAVRRNLR